VDDFDVVLPLVEDDIVAVVDFDGVFTVEVDAVNVDFDVLTLVEVVVFSHP
jgi:hypothetical protein